MPDPLPPMRGFAAAIAHLPAGHPQDQSGRFAIGLVGSGADRRLALSLRHADGTGLVVYLSDLAMGRFGDLMCDVYGDADGASASVAGGRLQ